MAIRGLINALRKESAKPSILKSKVFDYLVENADTLDQHSDEDLRFLTALMSRGTERNAEVFSPSGATNCKREQIITKSGFGKAKITDPHLLNIFEDGKWRHLRWQYIFYRMGILHAVEVFTTLGNGHYGGTPDSIVELVNDPYAYLKYLLETLYGVEIKGANASVWIEVNRSGKPLNHHMVQAQVYMAINNIGKWIFWYENKNTNEICEIVVDYDPKIAAHYLKRRNYMNKFLRLKGFPKEECNVMSKERKYTQCPQRRACPRLPVHVVIDGKLTKIGEPRKSDPTFASWNTLPLVKLEGLKGERVTQSLLSQN